MKIAISGGLGFVGGRLSKHLAEQGHHVVAYSRQAGSLPDIAWPENMLIAHPDEKSHLKGADVFIHLAALDENDCVKYPFKAIDVNIAQTVDWLEHVHQLGIRKFIYFSTAHVYGKPLEGYYDENSLPRPVHPYAITHKCAEDYVLAYSVDKGMSNVVLRLTNSFGGAAFPTANRWTLLVSDLCRSAVNSGMMLMSSDGLQPRDFICLEDVCRAVQHLLEQEKWLDIYNLAAGQSVTVWDMAQRVHRVAEQYLNKKICVKRKEPAPGKVAGSLKIDIGRLSSAGFALENNIDNEIRAALGYFSRYKV